MGFPIIKKVIARYAVAGIVPVFVLASMLLFRLPNETARAQAVLTEPVISAVTASPTDTGATITWDTDQAANSEVFYGTSAVYDSSTTPSLDDVIGHSEILIGLIPDTTYHYQVVSTNVLGSTTVSADQTFTTLASGETSTTTSDLSSVAGSSATSTDLQSELDQLQDVLLSLSSQIQALVANRNLSEYGSTTMII